MPRPTLNHGSKLRCVAFVRKMFLFLALSPNRKISFPRHRHSSPSLAHVVSQPLKPGGCFCAGVLWSLSPSLFLSLSLLFFPRLLDTHTHSLPPCPHIPTLKDLSSRSCSHLLWDNMPLIITPRCHAFSHSLAPKALREGTDVAETVSARVQTRLQLLPPSRLFEER